MRYTHKAAYQVAVTQPQGSKLRLALLKLLASGGNSKLRDQVEKILEVEQVEGEFITYSGKGMEGAIAPVAVELKDVTKTGPSSSVGKKLLALGMSHESVGKDVVYYTRASSKKASDASFYAKSPMAKLVISEVEDLGTDHLPHGINQAWKIKGTCRLPFANLPVVVEFFLQDPQSGV